MRRAFEVTAMVLGVVALAVIVALIARPKPEATVETKFVEKVRTVYVEETTHEETTATEPATEPADDVAATEETTTAEEEIRSAEELADLVLNAGLNGPDRVAYLGDRYEEVQAWIDANYEPPTGSRQVDAGYTAYDNYPASDALNPYDGINYYYGTLETYYNMDMSGVVDWMHDLGYEGDYWVREDGVKMFGNYVMVASDYDYEPKGTITETSLGLGIVCDTGLGGWAWHDIAVDW